MQRKFLRDSGLEFALDEITVSGRGQAGDLQRASWPPIDDGRRGGDPRAILGRLPVDDARWWAACRWPVNCPQNNGFKLRPEDLDAVITPRTKWLLLNFPNNPTGAACSADEMAALGEVMLRHPHVWIMSDDMYEHLLYTGARHATMAAVMPALRDRTLTICGRVQELRDDGVAGGVLRRAADADPGDDGDAGACHRRRVRHHAGRRRGRAGRAAGQRGGDQCRGISAAAGPGGGWAERGAPASQCHRPEGAFYVYPNIAGCLGKTTTAGTRIETDADFALALLEEQHVALVHGAAFGMSPYLRISYATDDATLAEGCRRIQAFCAALA